MDGFDDEEIPEYEALRRKNIAANRVMLIHLGLITENDPSQTNSPKKPSDPRKYQYKSYKIPKLSDTKPSKRPLTRRSSNLLEKDELALSDSEEEYEPSDKKKKTVQEQVFGEIPGVKVGDWWATRLECSAAGVHRPTVAGISGRSDQGCYSLALSGGYDDDQDYGGCFTYTGCGGRDLKGTKSKPKNLRTAPQSKDQVFEGLNAALALNIENRQPVRVIRGYKLPSKYAPELGYRYDGLYSVEKAWTATGLSNFKVCKFALKRLTNQADPPWINNVSFDDNKTDCFEFEALSDDDGLQESASLNGHVGSSTIPNGNETEVRQPAESGTEIDNQNIPQEINTKDEEYSDEVSEMGNKNCEETEEQIVDGFKGFENTSLIDETTKSEIQDTKGRSSVNREENHTSAKKISKNKMENKQPASEDMKDKSKQQNDGFKGFENTSLIDETTKYEIQDTKGRSRGNREENHTSATKNSKSEMENKPPSSEDMKDKSKQQNDGFKGFENTSLIDETTKSEIQDTKGRSSVNREENHTSATKNSKNEMENKPPASEDMKDKSKKQNGPRLIIPTSMLKDMIAGIMLGEGKQVIPFQRVNCQDESENLSEETEPDGWKQTSILDYFKQTNNTKPRQRKQSQNRPPQSNLTAKSLRSNRYLTPVLNVHIDFDNGLTLPNNQEEKSKHCSSDALDSLIIKNLQKQEPEAQKVIGSARRKNYRKSKPAAQTGKASASPSSPEKMKPCSVVVVKLPDGSQPCSTVEANLPDFLGWDDDSPFKGFTDDEKDKQIARSLYFKEGLEEVPKC